MSVKRLNELKEGDLFRFAVDGPDHYIEVVSDTNYKGEKDDLRIWYSQLGNAIQYCASRHEDVYGYVILQVPGQTPEDDKRLFEHYAAAALTGLLAGGETYSMEAVVGVAIRYADAMTFKQNKFFTPTNDEQEKK